ncbi:methyl-accepting chemotaxis protein [Sphingomonas sp. MM-1]|uniref:HAMP domain-containing methyl-accepting chemotaxis protein n=1 Tax=Sphingomonas sp. MM-1 TaxID=745310 RepID=UPI0002C10A3A|nr:methyl-accepting chemotaxis protein [Sphingomonas sp. MM-1]AGH49069.1 methyl-accepting chemotaxis protein [Sphingomonas sp. MM-1]
MQDALNNWRLPRKMLVAFALIAVFVVALGAAGLIANRHLSKIADEHVTSGIASVDALSDVRGYVREYRILMYSHVTSVSAAEMASLDDRIAKNKEKIDAALGKFAAAAGEEFTADVANIRAVLTRLEQVNARVVAFSRQDKDAEALALLKADGKEASHAAIDATRAVMDKTVALANARGEDGNKFSDNALIFMSVMVFFSLGALAIIWNLLNKTVSRPMAELTSVTTALAEGRQANVPHRDRSDELGEIAKAVELFRLAAVARAEADRKLAEEQKLVTATLGEGLAALAEGDLTAEVTAEFPAPVASLKTNFNDAIARLREMIGAVSVSAAGIRTGSQEIAQASEDLARRTEGNAASLEETSAALAQIDDRLKTSASASAQTVARADEALATVAGGRAVAEEAVQAMERVSHSAKGIDQVIEGVDKIAFQTRVLAMNAAVEAGRAGDAGRGFAVVADLVSALAMRAEEEAKRARDQLTVTQTDIVSAVDAVQRVDNALENISGGVGEVHGLLGQMAEDNQAQSSAISQISVAISTMDQSTQQNAAMVEQTSAAARNLTTEVTSLAEQAALFRVDNGRPQARRAATAPASAPVAKAAPAKPKPAPKRNQAYVSPVKALPVPAMANAAARLNGTNNEDWSDF